MPKFFIRWQADPTKTPTNPEGFLKVGLQAFQVLREMLKAGIMKDWGLFADGSGGYAISELNEADLYAAMVLRMSPMIIFDVKPVLTVDQAEASVKKALASTAKK